MSRFQLPILQSKRSRLPIHPSSNQIRLSKAGGIVAVTGGAVAATALLGGVLVAGAGVLAVGGLLVAGYWLRARGRGVWAHVRVESREGTITLAIPLPLSLARMGLNLAPIPSQPKQIALDVLSDAELLRALREEGIEVQVDDGEHYVEVYIGARKPHWPVFRLGSMNKPIPTIISLPTSSQKEDSHVG